MLPISYKQKKNLKLLHLIPTQNMGQKVGQPNIIIPLAPT